MLRAKYIAGLVGVIVAAGCGGGGPKLVPVDGTVTWNGKPVENVEVSFVPDAGNPAQTAGGDQTGPSGNYKAMFRGRSGLAPGKYKVYVKRVEPEMTTVGADKIDPYMARLGEEKLKKKQGPKPAVDFTRLSFDREVPETGGPIDLDVKARTL